jgi:hypothetical protein
MQVTVTHSLFDENTLYSFVWLLDIISLCVCVSLCVYANHSACVSLCVGVCACVSLCMCIYDYTVTRNNVVFCEQYIAQCTEIDRLDTNCAALCCRRVAGIPLYRHVR